MDNNLPDDCQCNGTHLPWNEPEQEIYNCWNCGAEFDCQSELTEVITKRNGLQTIGPCCIDDFS